MPIAPTYPGVYIEELPSGVHTITGVSTSVTAFLGFFKRGKMNTATQVFSVADLERRFGPLDPQSDAGYSIRQFFGNGGAEAWVVRVASGTPVASAVGIASVAGAAAVLQASAASEGVWGDGLRLDIDFGTTAPDTRFNLTVTELDLTGPVPQVVNAETFRNLTLDPNDSQFALSVVNDGSTLVRLTLVGSPAATALPAATGTVGADIHALALPGSLNATQQITATLVLPGSTVALGNFTFGTPLPTTVGEVAAVLQARIRALGATPHLPNATVSIIGSASTKQFLQVKAGHSNPAAIIGFAEVGTGTMAGALGLNVANRTNVQQYALGAAAAAGAQVLPGAGGTQVKGADGGVPDANAILGNAATKKGLFALDDVDIFNILCLPDTMNLTDTNAGAVITAAEAYCGERRAFFILDVPHKDRVRDQVDEIKGWLDQNATLRHKNAALYYPRPQTPDPLNGFRLRTVAPSGTIAGLYARIDTERGVWKAPAGTEAVLRGVQSLEYKLTDAENGTLNPAAINCLRTFPVYGNVCWGARTLQGDDQLASEWKYIPVRRTALFIEESLYRGTKWAVFEPNDEPLWGQIRLNIGAFMHDLFRQGAFQGKTPQEAYFVKCDKDTTTQTDIDHGIVNILVGFAPLKPAEFVIIKIQQIAGQIAT